MILTGVGHDAAGLDVKVHRGGQEKHLAKLVLKKSWKNFRWSHPPPPCTTKAKIIIIIKKIFQSFSYHEDTTN